MTEPQECLLHLKFFIVSRKDNSIVGILILVRIGMPVLIKVKGYARVRNGKVERVRSHYRRVWAAL